MQFDIIIVGAGPAGISCAIEAQKSGLRYLLLDKGGIADSIRQFQRDMFFFSTPELLEIGDVPFVVPTVRPTSLDCVNYYRAVIEKYKLQCQFFEQIVSIQQFRRGFEVRSERGNVYESKAVVIATGYYDTPNPLGVQGENLQHVSHYYRDALPYYQQNVLIVGGKNSAVEAALDLYRHGAHVAVVHRGTTLSSGVKYWILPDFENRVADGSIKLLLETSVKQFLPNKTELQPSNGSTFWIDNNFVFILIGYRPNVSFLQSCGIEVDSDTLVPFHNPETFETNIQNLFIAGGLVGGKFNNKVFIENGREHGAKIVSTLKSNLQ